MPDYLEEIENHVKWITIAGEMITLAVIAGYTYLLLCMTPAQVYKMPEVIADKGPQLAGMVDP